MTVEIRLQQVLREHNMVTHGVISKIASQTGIQRTTIQRLYDNKFTNPSLEALGKVCDWLQKNGVPAELLPHSLFRRPPDGPWAACVKQGRIDLYLGEYQQIDLSRPRKWIAKRDAAVAMEIIRILLQTHAQLLTEDPNHEHPDIDEDFVPFRFVAQDGASKTKEGSVFHEDVSNSKRMLEQLKKRGRAAILIGSMRVNYLVEHFIADLFRCEPFKPDANHRIPIYMMHRPNDVNAPSCFGGQKPPAGFKGDKLPGIYFRNAKGKWEQRPSMYREHDVGVAVIAYNTSDESIRIAVFGFSGRATFCMKQYLSSNANEIWPPTANALGAWKVGIYIFKMKFKEKTTDRGEQAAGDKKRPPDEQSEEVEKCEIEALDDKVLESALDLKTGDKPRQTSEDGDG